MRVLVTDALFPNKLAKWRLVEIQAFIERYETDILILNRPDEFAGVVFDFDWEALLESHHLENYDLCIFNPKFNHLNKFNTDFDGTQFNGQTIGFLSSSAKTISGSTNNLYRLSGGLSYLPSLLSVVQFSNQVSPKSTIYTSVSWRWNGQ